MTRTTKILGASVVAVVVGWGIFYGLELHRRLDAARTVLAAQQTPGVQTLPGGGKGTPAFYLDVYSPAALWKAARESVWLRKATAEPLGQGFAVGWSAFLGTHGTDLAGAFEGTVLDQVTSRLLSDPFRVLFQGYTEATGTPAVLVPRASSTARAAFELLDRAARRGEYAFGGCAGSPEGTLRISRWLIADHAVFAARRGQELALSRNPVAVAQALCSDLKPMAASRGVDLSITVRRDGFGHESELGAALLGLPEETTFLFGLEEGRLLPRGISGRLEITASPRLGSAAPSEDLLKLVPGDAGLVLLATLNLPDALDRQTLKQHLEGSYGGQRLPRTVALVFNPAPGRTEVALIWPERDAQALGDAFTGPNRMVQRRACRHLLLASTPALAAALEQSCSGKAPSVLNGPKAVASGMRQPVSLGLYLNLGTASSRLLSADWTAEHGKLPAPPEIQSAQRLLEELPFLGLCGVVEDGVLTPGGFRS
ncbi:MAG TPA: hypothetical protein VFG59_00640 [Anaeromyxobacter sp.]|nr:hypothetical protein [Anaeromyxobacter sp.]